MVLGDGLKPVLTGAIGGLAAALALTRVLSSFLFQLQPTDPIVFRSVLLLLFAAAVMACSIPARRATRVDPVVALRHE